MSSQTAVLPETLPRLAGQPMPDAISVSLQVTASPLSFTVSPAVEGVTVDPQDSSILLISPGNYFLNFTVLDDTFENPAIVLNTPFGQLNIPPAGAATATLPDINGLVPGDSQQVFPFIFNFLTAGPADPTIVNTPDPV